MGAPSCSVLFVVLFLLIQLAPRLLTRLQELRGLISMRVMCAPVARPVGFSQLSTCSLDKRHTTKIVGRPARQFPPRLRGRIIIFW